MVARMRCLSQRRAQHARCRLEELRKLVPDLPDDALDKTSLRWLSFSVRRVRKGCQSTLKEDSSEHTHKSSHNPADVRSTEPNLGGHSSQKSFHQSTHIAISHAPCSHGAEGLPAVWQGDECVLDAAARNLWGLRRSGAPRKEQPEASPGGGSC